MARAGTSKVDFYPDPLVQDLLKDLPPNSRSATLNNLVKAHLSPNFADREKAEIHLSQILHWKNKTEKAQGGWVENTNKLFDVFTHLCDEYKIRTTRVARKYATIKFSQALRDFEIDPEQCDLFQNKLVQSAFFKTVSEMRYWESRLALADSEVQFLADNWKDGHPPLEDGQMVVIELQNGVTVDEAIKKFVYEWKDFYLAPGVTFTCRYKQDGKVIERHLVA